FHSIGFPWKQTRLSELPTPFGRCRPTQKRVFIARCGCRIYEPAAEEQRCTSKPVQLLQGASEPQSNPRVEDSLTRQFRIGGNWIQPIIFCRSIQHAQGHVTPLSGETKANQKIQLQEGIAGQIRCRPQVLLEIAL